MRWWTNVVLLLAAAFTLQGVQGQRCYDVVDMMFVIDGSNGLTGSEFERLKTLVKDYLRTKEDASTQSRINAGYIVVSENVETQLAPTSSYADFADSLDKVTFSAGRSLVTGAAIEVAFSRLLNVNSPSGTPKIIIALVSQRSANTVSTQIISNFARQYAMTVWGVGLKSKICISLKDIHMTIYSEYGPRGATCHCWRPGHTEELAGRPERCISAQHTPEPGQCRLWQRRACNSNTTDNSEAYNTTTDNSETYNTTTDNSETYNTTTDNSKAYNTKTDNSTAYNSKTNNSKAINATADNPKAINTKTNNSKTVNTKTDNSKTTNSLNCAYHTKTVNTALNAPPTAIHTRNAYASHHYPHHHSTTYNFEAVADRQICLPKPISRSGLCKDAVIVTGVGIRGHPTEPEKYIQCYFPQILGGGSRRRRRRQVTSGFPAVSMGTTNTLAVIRQCAFGLFWNQETLTCNPASSVSLEEGERSHKTTAEGPKWKLHEAVSGNCRAYYLCINGRSTPFCCPSGYAYTKFGCMDCPSCTENCMTGTAATSYACNYQPVWNKPDSYRAYRWSTDGGSYVEQQCAESCYFNLATCDCAYKPWAAGNDTVPPPVCQPAYTIGLSQVGLGGAKVHAALENDDAFASYSGPLVIEFRYRELQEIVSRHALLSSSDCPRAGFLLITVDREGILVEVTTERGVLTSLSLPTIGFKPDDYKTFRLVDNNDFITATVTDGRDGYTTRVRGT
ncbi:sushi-like protein [Plakobranchus ocellatus]|uniref:Sushi-like protein n=1 Tax=Plakobranchus ocellatus TaxID=259542 RepID=A0AAV4BH17_9GAST|nr:sushi-like protein [Plakobranchus ocellatus]